MKRATEKTEQFSSSSQPSIIFEWLAALDLICLFTLHFAHVHDFQRQARPTKKKRAQLAARKGISNFIDPPFHCPLHPLSLSPMKRRKSEKWIGDDEARGGGGARASERGRSIHLLFRKGNRSFVRFSLFQKCLGRTDAKPSSAVGRSVRESVGRI